MKKRSKLVGRVFIDLHLSCNYGRMSTHLHNHGDETYIEHFYEGVIPADGVQLTIKNAVRRAIISARLGN